MSVDARILIVWVEVGRQELCKKCIEEFYTNATMY